MNKTRLRKVKQRKSAIHAKRVLDQSFRLMNCIEEFALISNNENQLKRISLARQVLFTVNNIMRITKSRNPELKGDWS